MSKAVIYTKPSCPFCIKAKQLLNAKGVQIEEHIVGEAVTKQQVCEAVGRQITTVPQIVLDGQYIGGYTDLAAFYGAAP